MLDGLRGVSALVIVIFHGIGSTAFKNGYLMVDLFFIISGFVISYSYDERFESGYRNRDFLRARFIRLYPMIFVGALFSSALSYGIILSAKHPDLDFRSTTIANLLSFLCLPYWSSNSSDDIFPTNTVLWSLFFEIMLSVLYCFARKWSFFLLLIISIISLLTVMSYSLGGQAIGNFWLGVPRSVLGFFIGMMLFRLTKKYHFYYGFGIFTSAILIIFISNMNVDIKGINLSFIFLIFSILVFFCAQNADNVNSLRLCRLLGDLSFPMYVLHRPFLILINHFAKKLFGISFYVQVLSLAFTLAISICVSLVILRYYDKPLRQALSKYFRNKTE